METSSMQAKTALGRVIAILSIVSALALIIVAMIVVDKRPRTHDAYIFAYSAGITPEVSGRIVAIHIRNDQYVHHGDVLLQIDPEPFELKLRQANAQVAALQAEIDLTGRQVTAQGSGAQAAARNVDRAQQQLALAHDTLARMEPLLPKGFVTAQQIDEARTNERTAASQLAAATQQAAQAKEAIGDVESLKAQLLGAEAEEALAGDRHSRIGERQGSGFQSRTGIVCCRRTSALYADRRQQLVRRRQFSRDGSARAARWRCRNGMGDGQRRAAPARRGGKPGCRCSAGRSRRSGASGRRSKPELGGGGTALSRVGAFE
jgi:multidrug efflux pump subunit AcrA (membrane-fusion protein)